MKEPPLRLAGGGRGIEAPLQPARADPAPQRVHSTLFPTVGTGSPGQGGESFSLFPSRRPPGGRARPPGHGADGDDDAAPGDPYRHRGPRLQVSVYPMCIL